MALHLCHAILLFSVGWNNYVCGSSVAMRLCDCQGLQFRQIADSVGLRSAEHGTSRSLELWIHNFLDKDTWFCVPVSLWNARSIVDFLVLQSVVAVVVKTCGCCAYGVLGVLAGRRIRALCSGFGILMGSCISIGKENTTANPKFCNCRGRCNMLHCSA